MYRAMEKNTLSAVEQRVAQHHMQALATSAHDHAYLGCGGAALGMRRAHDSETCVGKQTSLQITVILACDTDESSILLGAGQ